MQAFVSKLSNNRTYRKALVVPDKKILILLKDGTPTIMQVPPQKSPDQVLLFEREVTLPAVTVGMIENFLASQKELGAAIQCFLKNPKKRK